MERKRREIDAQIADLQAQLANEELLSQQAVMRDDQFAADRVSHGNEPPSADVRFWPPNHLVKRGYAIGKIMNHPDGYNLRLYVAGQTPKSIAAIANLKKICEQHLSGRYNIEVIDLMKNPALAQRHQIVAIPTLIRQLPEPLKRIIGDLSNLEKVLVGLDIHPT